MYIKEDKYLRKLLREKHTIDKKIKKLQGEVGQMNISQKRVFTFAYRLIGLQLKAMNSYSTMLNERISFAQEENRIRRRVGLGTTCKWWERM